MQIFPPIKFPLSHDVSHKIVRVGDMVVDEPELERRSEWDWDFKLRFVPDGEVTENLYSQNRTAKQNHKLFIPLLGPRFAYRYQAAHYYTWLAPYFSQKTANMLRFRGKYDNAKVRAAHEVLPYVQEAELDGLWNLIPLIVACRQSPEQMKRAFGKGLWRRLANNSCTRNQLIMQNVFDAEGSRIPDGIPIAERLSSSWLRLGLPISTDAIIADRSAPNKKSDTLHVVLATVRDCQHMTGARFNPEWSWARMQEEHHNAVREQNAKRYSGKPFADPFCVERDGMKATLLTSPLDIANEGRIQRHCVASYADRAAKRQYAVFAIEGRHRATLGIDILCDGTRGNGLGMRINQVYGACNAIMPDEVHEFSRYVQGEYLTHWQSGGMVYSSKE